MKVKSTPIICKVLSFLSGFNLIVMALCVLFILSAQHSFINHVLLIGPLAEILINQLVNTIGSILWIFVVVNIIISLGMLISALVIHQLKKSNARSIPTTSAVLGS